jgi:predicted metal-dependent hydrolase
METPEAEARVENSEMGICLKPRLLSRRLSHGEIEEGL